MNTKVEIIDEELQFCSFYIQDQLYAVNILEVKEIVKESGILKIPHTGEELQGYMNIRGQIHLVIDLRILLGLPKSETPKKDVIIFKPSVGESFGIIVDRISDVLEITNKNIENDFQKDDKSNQLSHIKNEMIAGLGNKDKNVFIILKPKLFLQCIDEMYSKEALAN